MNFRERLEQSRDRVASGSDAASVAELEDTFSCEYFATDNIKSLPACLDLRLPNGSRKAIPYNYVVEISYDPLEGIKLITTTKIISISGRNLSKLYDFLAAYRVRFIKADIGKDLNEDGIFVGEILLNEIS